MQVAVNKAHLGRDFEQKLEQAHAMYAAKGVANVKKNPNEWKYTNQTAYNKMLGYRADLVARTNTGRFIKRVTSNVDFSGVAGGRCVMFDAKQVSRQNFPLVDLPPHQLETLCFAEQCGAISGLMIRFTTYGRTFFVSAGYVRRMVTEAETENGKKSIAL